MKRLLFAAVAVCLALSSGCKKEETPKYKLTLEVSYYYNKYQGYKPDVGASCKLYSGYVKSDTTSAHSYTVRNGKTEVYPITDGYGTIGVSGTYEYSNLSPGKYTIVVNSRGRLMYSEKQFELNSDMKLTHNFEYYNEYEHTPEYWW